ncbi:S-adenosyl-L-methionine-dependent methyltransferase [Xylaria venustula]|nr:S-adenosyl-L-methionine-dependent methyltransferase [Xylaria venustula]
MPVCHHSHVRIMLQSHSLSILHRQPLTMNDHSTIYQQVNSHYGTLARGAQPTYSSAISKAFGYSDEELDSIPAQANLGVSCGNPLAIASLHEGETVVDLGSGAGFDILLASRRVGESGRAIGIDMNKDMLEKSRRNQSKLPNAHNVSFIEAKITSIPLEDGIADCIISNCVINLVPEGEKPAVFTEMARLLKPGGRVAVSDILVRKPLPSALRENAALYVGCVAGASTKDDYTRWLKDAGFKDTMIVDTKSDLNIYIDMARAAQIEKRDNCGCSNPPEIDSALPQQDSRTFCTNAEAPSTFFFESNILCCGEDAVGGSSNETEKSGIAAVDCDLIDIDINEWAGSFKIFAVKD